MFAPADTGEVFASFFATWRPRLTAFAYRRFDACEIDEIVQETLVRALVHFDELQDRDPWPWLATVARNVACDLHRRQRWTAGDEPHWEEMLGGPATPEEALEHAETRGVLGRALARLRPDERQVLLMRLVEELSFDEIGDALGISEGVVRVRLHRARRRLSAAYRAVADASAFAPIPLALAALRKLRRVLVTSSPATVAATGLALSTTVLGTTYAAVPGGSPAAGAPMPAVHQVAVVDEGDTPVAAVRGAGLTGPAVAPSGTTGTPAPSSPAPPSAVPRVVAPEHRVFVASDPRASGRSNAVELTVTTPVGNVVLRNEGWNHDGVTDCPLLPTCP